MHEACGADPITVTMMPPTSRSSCPLFHLGRHYSNKAKKAFQEKFQLPQSPSLHFFFPALVARFFTCLGILAFRRSVLSSLTGA